MQVKTACTGAPTSANYTVSPISGITIDGANVLVTGNDSGACGNGHILDTGAARRPMTLLWNEDANVIVPQFEGGSFTLSNITQAAPQTFASGDNIVFTVRLPITEWNG